MQGYEVICEKGFSLQYFSLVSYKEDDAITFKIGSSCVNEHASTSVNPKKQVISENSCYMNEEDNYFPSEIKDCTIDCLLETIADCGEGKVVSSFKFFGALLKEESVNNDEARYIFKYDCINIQEHIVAQFTRRLYSSERLSCMNKLNFETRQNRKESIQKITLGTEFVSEYDGNVNNVLFFTEVTYVVLK